MLRRTRDLERAEREERILRSRNFHRGRFKNPIRTTILVPGRGLEVAKDWLTAAGPRRPPAPLPSVPVTRDSFVSPPRDDVRVCWLGHSTVLLELEGLRLLFDPIWARRSSPSRLAGPLRFQPCPLPLEELPELTAVVVSHDHYDHLDRGVARFLARRDPHLPWFTPLGVGAHLAKWGVAEAAIRELDWEEEGSAADGRLRLVATPSRHFSGRSLLDRNRTQWCSWAVLGRRHRIYFGGDGGYHPGFADIGERFGPFDLVLLEIGAFHPNWGQVHLGPENALRACRELGGRRLLPIHWGTFNLAIHPWDEPIETLVAKAPQAGVELLVPRFGEVVRLRDAPPVTAWWRSRA